MNRSPSPLERLGNALAFGLVLAIVVLGGYAIFNIVRGQSDFISFGGSEEVRPTPVVVIRPPTLTPFAGLDLLPTATLTPLFVQPSPAPPTATPEPQIETVVPPTETPLPPTATPPPPPTATPAPPTATPFPTETPLPTPVPPTPTPAFSFRIAAAGPAFDRGCDGHYIFGYVRDSSGNPLPGLRVRVTNQYGLEIPAATTKSDPPGWYDVPISGERALWYVQVVDASNSALSPVAEVLNTGSFVLGSEACWHEVDFTRVN